MPPSGRMRFSEDCAFAWLTELLYYMGDYGGRRRTGSAVETVLPFRNLTYAEACDLPKRAGLIGNLRTHTKCLVPTSSCTFAGSGIPMMGRVSPRVGHTNYRRKRSVGRSTKWGAAYRK